MVFVLKLWTWMLFEDVKLRMMHSQYAYLQIESNWCVNNIFSSVYMNMFKWLHPFYVSICYHLYVYLQVMLIFKCLNPFFVQTYITICMHICMWLIQFLFPVCMHICKWLNLFYVFSLYRVCKWLNLFYMSWLYAFWQMIESSLFF